MDLICQILIPVPCNEFAQLRIARCCRLKELLTFRYDDLESLFGIVIFRAVCEFVCYDWCRLFFCNYIDGELLCSEHDAVISDSAVLYELGFSMLILHVIDADTAFHILQCLVGDRYVDRTVRLPYYFLAGRLAILVVFRYINRDVIRNEHVLSRNLYIDRVCLDSRFFREHSCQSDFGIIIGSEERAEFTADSWAGNEIGINALLYEHDLRSC